MSITRYRAGLRAAVRGLWSGALDYDQAFDAMMAAIRSGITRAWHEGAAQCGIRPDELSPEEQMELQRFIQGQFGQIARVLNWVEQNRKELTRQRPPEQRINLLSRKGNLTVYGRLEMWINQYPSAVMKSAAMACADEKRIWTLGIVEKHCKTCPALAGKVKRMSFWLKHVLPRNAPNDKLECGGYR